MREDDDVAEQFRREMFALDYDTDGDPMPQPGDGPEYHADLQFWRERQSRIVDVKTELL